MFLLMPNPFFIAMRYAAHERHEMLVKFWIPAGAQRTKELAQHRQFVDGLYDYCKV